MRLSQGRLPSLNEFLDVAITREITLVGLRDGFLDLLDLPIINT
jgi:hypothetical protein